MDKFKTLAVLTMVAIAATITFSCGKSDPPDPPKPTVVKVTKITLNKTATTIIAGSNEQLSVTEVLPANATDKGVTWSSDNSAIATVSDGLVSVPATATSGATVIINATAKDGSGVKGTCTVTVVAAISVTGITISPSENIYIEVGTTATLTATVTPSNATNKTVTWNSLNTGIATVSISTGIVTGVSAGSTTIRATAAGGSGITAEKTITVIATDGSSGNPFIVYNVATLQKVGTGTGGWTYNKHYKQIANINMSGIKWTPICSAEPNGFTGSYDGGEFTISNLNCTVTSGDAGLFYFVKNGVIKNVKLNSITISGNGCVGGITATNIGATIQNCVVTSGSVAANSTNGFSAGGVVGTNNGGIVKNCSASCNVSGRIHVGGVVGSNGITNASTYGVITHCYATGNVTATGYNVGGVAGENVNECTIQSSYATGNVIATGTDANNGRKVGGVVGINGGVIQNCYATGNVSGLEYVGGIIGENYNGTVQYCYATGNVNGTNRYVGGLVAWNYGTGTVKNCVALGKTVATSSAVTTDIGRVIGTNNSTVIAPISNNYARSDMMLTRNGTNYTPPNKATSGTDGSDVAATNYNGSNSSTWWGTGMTGQMQFHSASWTVRAYGLPILKDVGGTQNPTVTP